MAKTFYTEHDIEDMARRGVQSLVLSDDVVLTELAYEKAGRLGLKLVRPVDTPPSAPVRPYIAKETHAGRAPSAPTAASGPMASGDLQQRIKDAVMARLGAQGAQVDTVLLDTIIQRVLAAVEKR
jgi:hypothetical protein